MKRDPQVFAWVTNFVNGLYTTLVVTGRKDGPRDGEKLTFPVSAYPDEIRERLLAAGHKALFQQRTSQIDDDIEKMGAWEDLHERLVSGEWEAEGGQRGAPIVGAWVEVLAQVKNTTVGVIQASLAGMTKDARAAVRANVEKKYAERIEAVKTARKAQALDLTDL